MVDKKGARSFDEIIQEGRKKSKAEALAQQIFGKNRRSSTPTASGRNTPGGSLASRVGVTKRSASTTLNNRVAAPSGRVPRGPSQFSRSQVRNTAPAVKNAVAAQERQGVANGSAAEFSIRGASGPYCIIAENFAHGTTPQDIESVMIPIGGEMDSCRLLSDHPTVIAEMVFREKAGADTVISMFNNKKADGSILYVYYKKTNDALPSSGHATRVAAPVAPEPIPVEEDEIMIDDNVRAPNAPASNVVDPRNEERIQRDLFARSAREDRDYRNNEPPREPRRANPAYQDGRYGFGSPRDNPRYGGRDDRRGGYRDGGRMYSDNMMRRGGGAGRNQSYRP